MFNDGMSITINFKWLLQIIAATAIVVYSFWVIEGRIQTLERKMIVAMEGIELYEQERRMEMQERMEWYETALNLNPFSWGKGRKNKK